MPMTKINRKEEERTSELIKKLLNIKDSNLYFVEELLSKETISEKLSNVFTSVLTYTPSRCPACGRDNVLSHSAHHIIKRFLTTYDYI